MTFEEKLSEIYNKIANEISGMIPVEWEKVYTIAYVDDEGGEVVFNYTKPGSDELNYYTYIPREYNVSEKVFYDLWTDLYRLFKKLRDLFKEDLDNVSEKVFYDLWTDLYRLFKKLRDLFKEDLEPWTSCEFDFTREGNLKVSFDYIDWIKLGFGPSGKENYYMYKKFGILPETEYEINKVKEVEKCIKEQE
ncbi:TIGR01741 family protein [Staphylococcus aureus]|uniref:TIGR01741 family protein n=14 Tax=Staphylococcus aureus TaxID=1280 RepID=UPI003DA6B89B